MGGKLFNSKRISIEEYFKIQETWVSLFEMLKIRCLTIPFVLEKKSFGDLDLVVELTDTSKKCVLNFLKNLGIQSISVNSNIVSFLYNDFQIDLIFISKEYLEYAQAYFSYNDLGNLLGKLLKKLGFKHGMYGLEYVIRDHSINSQNKIIDTFLLSLDPYKHLEILKLNVETFKKGFLTFEELYQYVSSSPYFNKAYYSLHHATNKDRIRDKKRITYTNFLKFCENLPDLQIPVIDRTFLPYLYYPDLPLKVEESYKKLQQAKSLSEKINGNIIKSYLNIEGKALGTFINYLFSTNDKKDFISFSEDEIKNIILSSYSKYLLETTS